MNIASIALVVLTFTDLTLFRPAFAATGRWIADFDRGTGSVEFKAIGRPSALRIIGKGAAPKGRFGILGNKVTGTATFDLVSLDTGIKMRNQHMQEKYLQTGKYRRAALSLNALILPKAVMATSFQLDDVPFVGKLVLHGVQKAVSGLTSLQRDGNTLSIKAQFTIKLSEFGIGVPSFMGITVADETQITVVESALILQMPQ